MNDLSESTIYDEDSDNDEYDAEILLRVPKQRRNRQAATATRQYAPILDARCSQSEEEDEEMINVVESSTLSHRSINALAHNILIALLIFLQFSENTRDEFEGFFEKKLK